MAQTQNYVGATLFWLYIVEALIFTGVILQTLLQTFHDSIHPSKKFWLKIFSSFVTISFTALSFNMLHVLVKSYKLLGASTSNEVDLAVYVDINLELVHKFNTIPRFR
jgi:hypothetical protein